MIKFFLIATTLALKIASGFHGCFDIYEDIYIGRDSVVTIKHQYSYSKEYLMSLGKNLSYSLSSDSLTKSLLQETNLPTYQDVSHIKSIKSYSMHDTIVGDTIIISTIVSINNIADFPGIHDKIWNHGDSKIPNSFIKDKTVVAKVSSVKGITTISFLPPVSPVENSIAKALITDSTSPQMHIRVFSNNLLNIEPHSLVQKIEGGQEWKFPITRVFLFPNFIGKSVDFKVQN